MKKSTRAGRFTCEQSEIDEYKGILYHGVPVTAILQAYSICQIQPDPGFSDDNNYLKNAFAEAEHVDFSKGLEKQTVLTKIAGGLQSFRLFACSDEPRGRSLICARVQYRNIAI